MGERFRVRLCSPVARAGKSASLALQHLAKPELERPKEQVRTNIEIEEAYVERQSAKY